MHDARSDTDEISVTDAHDRDLGHVTRADRPAGTDEVSREIAHEQRHVDAVYRRLTDLARSAQHVASDGRSLYQSDRISFVREEDGTGLFERDAFSFQAAKRLAVLDAEHDGLVFGRLDRRDGDVRYIGRLGVRDEEYEPLVIDWRAPAAEPFYRATPADPMAVVRRRVLRCRGERVIGIEDDLLDGEGAGDLVVVGDGALLAALSRSRGPRMRDIVATIQAAQDEAIRAPYAGFTVITGGPGTGKTVVALHRAAFLLYSHRRRFTSGGVLVVGPSSVFMNYIERVLPSLGEDAVTLRAIGQVAGDVVAGGGERVDDAAAARVKGGLRMLPVLRRLVRDSEVLGAVTDLRIMVKGEPITLSAEELDRVRSEVLRHHTANRGREAALTQVLARLRRRWQASGVEDHLEAPERLDEDGFADLVTQTASWRMFAQVWWRRVEAPEALARLADPVLLARVADSVLSAAEQQALVDSYRGLDRSRPQWTVADVALLDELVVMLGIPEADPDEEPEESIFLPEDATVQELTSISDRLRTQRTVDPDDEPYATYAHILVDEAQDITPMQWRMLRRRGAHASWTIVGDLAQTSWHDAEESRRALEEVIGTAPQRRYRMTTNYRSPAEVYDLAGRVITAAFPDADLPTAVRSTGHAPQLRVVADRPDPAGDPTTAALAAAVTELGGQVEGTIAVITAPDRQERLGRELADAGLDESVAARLSVVSAQQSKGLEWDAVVVFDADDIVARSAGAERLLYVAMTRPTQRLIMLDPTPGAAWRRSLGSPRNGSA